MSRKILFSFGLRTAVLWIIVRALVMPLAFMPAVPGLEPRSTTSALTLDPVTAVFVAALVTALVLLDVRALRERTFLANLGVPRRSVAVFAFGIVLVFELAVSTIGAAA